MKSIGVVNEDRLLSLIPDFFEKPENVLIEIAQNSLRSGATELDIVLNGDVLKVSDNGNGTDNPKALFTLADSDWSKEVEENQKPAGWGLFFLLSISKRATFCSRFGSVTVDCNRFLKEKEYREEFWKLLDSPLKDDSYSGFNITAILKDGVNNKILNEKYNLSFFPLNININGEILEKGNIEKGLKDQIVTSYQGNDVYINIPHVGHSHYKNYVNADYGFSLGVLWYGIPVNINPDSRTDIIINVKTGTPLTPVLPYRHTVKRDEKYIEFMKFVKQEIVNYCIQNINSDAYDGSISFLVSNMVAFATQDEIDSLNRFSVTKTEPYHDGEHINSGGSVNVTVTRKDMPLISEDIEITGIDNFDRFYLPAGAITSVELPARYPDWIKVDNVVHAINIKSDSEGQYSGHLQWSKAEIDSDLGIDVVAISDGWGSCEVFYKESPESFHDIEDVVFDNEYYNDDADTWEAQEQYFNDEISNDINHIIGKHDVSSLFKGFNNVGVSPYAILSVAIINKQMIVKTAEGERVLGLR